MTTKHTEMRLKFTNFFISRLLKYTKIGIFVMHNTIWQPCQSAQPKLIVSSASNVKLLLVNLKILIVSNLLCELLNTF
jgi:hypothetical protein